MLSKKRGDGMGFDPQKLEEIPRLPGVYLMKDAQGRTLYVGKAKNLRARVRSYFRVSGDGRDKIRFLLQRLAELEVVVTRSEKEALILENTFIKKYRPRYNVAFRDDKSYFHIRIDLGQPFPRVGLVRRPQKDGALYFGPYASSHSVRQTLRLLQKHMGLRACKDTQMFKKDRTCLNYQMGRCAGVCRGEVTIEEYAGKVQEAVLFLQGSSKQLLANLGIRMKEASDALRFEEAARIRDQIRAIESTLERQRAVTLHGPDRDVLGFHRMGDEGVIVMIQIREGKVLESLPLPLRPSLLEDKEVVSSFLKQYYDSPGRYIPPEILVPFPLREETRVLEQWLGDLSGHRVKIRCPQRGEVRDLLDMAQENARLARVGSQGMEDALVRLASLLDLRRTPRIMEGYDISNLGGEEAVGSAVRFSDGSPDRRAYRSYGIRTVEGVDDYAMMFELLSRHLHRRLDQGDLPDLIVVDGGKGQLGVAQAVLEELGLSHLDVLALAKGGGLPTVKGEESRDRVFVPGRKEAVNLRRDPGLIRMLQQLRDEAHRFALTRHRKRRGRKRMASSLDGIKGIGPARKRALLKHMGSLRRLREATVQELYKVPGISESMARVIFETLHSGQV
jgi:excinuclease ABC subunit C